VEIPAFLDQVIEWAQDQPGLMALALVGSQERGTARPDSDVDLVLLARDPRVFLEDTGWVGAFGQPTRQQTDDYGKLTSLRVWYAGGLEVEFGLTTLDWGSDPPDEGDARVIRDGIKVLYDRDGRFSANLEILLTEDQ